MSNIVKIGEKYYDFGTRNSSFLLTCQELKALGIKNWYFPLEVKYAQYGVQDIDPWKKDITPKEIGLVHMESKDNVWYYVREVAKVPARGAPVTFDPILTRASCAAIWCFDHSIDFRLCQPRQTHKTTHCTILSSHGFLYDINRAAIPYVHIKDSRATDNASELRTYITDGLPPYMNPWLKQKKLPGVKSIRYEAHDAAIKIISSANSPEDAMDKLRGETIYLALMDEWEYIPYYDYMMAGAAPAITSAKNIAKQIGQRTCIMSISTPGNLQTQEGKAAQHIIDNTPRFSERYYDLTDEEIENMLNGQVDPNDPEKQPVTTFYIEFDYIQLRKDENWLRQQYNEAKDKNKLDEYRRGVLLERYRGGDIVLFRQEDIEYIQQNQVKPDYEMLLQKKYILYVYKHDVVHIDLTTDTPYFDINLPYLIGVDPASGSGGDSTAIVIVHPYTLQVVGELKSQFMSILDCMRVITELAKILPRSVFCVESNNIGKTIVAFVEESQLMNRFYCDPRLDISQNATISDLTRPSLTERSQRRQYIGTALTPGVRKNMMELLKRYMRDYRHLLVARFLVDDITKLTIHKNGKIAAENGEHDDIVMAWLHTIYVLTYGQNLGRYGIDKSLCTYEKVNEILDEFETDIAENTVDNTQGYDFETLYENQLLHDLINQDNKNFDAISGRDVYGYKRSDYDDHKGLQKTIDNNSLSQSDLTFFRSVNNFY